MNVSYDPLVAAPPSEVPLPNAPLVRVIAQVRFPLIVAIEQRDFIAPFQEAIRSRYPVLRQEQTQGLVMTSSGMAPSPAHNAWRFSDLEGSWRVSLTSDFLAIDTDAYTSRAEFFERLRHVLAALNEHVQPNVLDRLGVRYVDRVMGEPLKDIAKLVRPEICGIMGTDAAVHVQSALTEAVFNVDDTQVLTRWGYLPKGATIDPAAIVPADEPSWILDVDMSRTNQRPFVVDQVVEDAKQFAERIYTIFRWAVTADFLRTYGGQI